MEKILDAAPKTCPSGSGPCPKGRALTGFTVLELVVVLSIMLLLGFAAFKGLGRYLPEKRVRTEATRLDAILRAARQKAIVSQRPVRVAIDCGRKKADRCLVSSQTAILSAATVSGWEPPQDDPHRMHPGVLIMATDQGKASFDGARHVNDVIWAIFMPNSLVYSDPRPFDVFLFHHARPSRPTRGQRITVGRENGRVTLRQDSIRI
ncbi:MAG: hypothetical protein LBL95_02540 [Deltaproteobacteria bacterium]|jgi:Tfp pilus assembly protein FimT|nr:hypothetical protein [Deltaproteobacteria bacterium]